MTKQEAIEALNRGERVTHRHFLPNEYIQNAPDPHFYLDEARHSISVEWFWTFRDSPDFEDGWYIYQDPRQTPGDDDTEEEEFTPCSQCDGHPACEDFGCAIDLGLGHMVKRDIM